MVARMNGSSAIFMKKSLFCSVALSCFALRTIGQTSAPTPATATAQRAAEVDSRGDQGMGFSHDMTGHHFHLFSDGGAIEVESNSPDDESSKAAIRRHLQKIAGMFGQGGLFAAYVYPRHCAARRRSNETPKRSKSSTPPTILPKAQKCE